MKNVVKKSLMVLGSAVLSALIGLLLANPPRAFARPLNTWEYPVFNMLSSQTATIAAPTTFSGTVAFTAGTTPQTLAAGFTIKADACGGMKLVQAAAGVSSSTTDAFTSTATATAYCFMDIVNISSQPITLLSSTEFLTKSGGNYLLLNSSDVVRVLALPTTGWVMVGGTK